MRSIATVHKHVENLERKGFIRRGYNRSRSIDLISPGRRQFGKRAESRRASPAALPPETAPREFEFPLLGRIAAGRPVEAVATAETLSLEDFSNRSGEVFVLKVTGDSMIDDHICDGDYILVQRAREAANGEIVVALIDKLEATLKRLFHEPKGKVRLQPANSQMDPIVLPAGEVEVQGRVIGVLRKY
ncbi:MAG: transcriptional repressor LexA [Terriglobia bacterium]